MKVTRVKVSKKKKKNKKGKDIENISIEMLTTRRVNCFVSRFSLTFVQIF